MDSDSGEMFLSGEESDNWHTAFSQKPLQDWAVDPDCVSLQRCGIVGSTGGVTWVKTVTNRYQRRQKYTLRMLAKAAPFTIFCDS